MDINDKKYPTNTPLLHKLFLGEIFSQIAFCFGEKIEFIVI